MSAVAIGSRTPAARIGAGTLLVVGAENNHTTTTMFTFRGDACLNRKRRGVPASMVLPIRLLGGQVKGLIKRQAIYDCSAVWANVFLYNHANVVLGVDVSRYQSSDPILPKAGRRPSPLIGAFLPADKNQRIESSGADEATALQSINQFHVLNRRGQIYHAPLSSKGRKLSP